jgi:hypothetical protein
MTAFVLRTLLKIIMTEVTQGLKNSKENTFIGHILLCFITLTLTLQRLRFILYFKLSALTAERTNWSRLHNRVW